MKNKILNVGSDFSGVGAFNQALKRLNINYNEVFACEIDKYARQTFIYNYGEPNYFPENVYNREIPTKSLDIYMTSPPCQAFSFNGSRKGKNDLRGILFFNSLEFIRVNQPRFFIFENVKGLLSDDNGKTFSEWVNYLGGKSINGLPVLFPYENAVNYHLYYDVLNAKNYGVPQNRERVFLIGIRDDKDNYFTFPKTEYLTKTIRDILETNVKQSFYLSNETINNLIKYKEKQKLNGNGFSAKFHDVNGSMSALSVGGRGADDLIKIETQNQENNKRVIVHDVPEIVKIRKNKIEIKELQKLLKTHKTKNNSQIAKELNVKVTTVEHWFRVDNYFSIPTPEIWEQLKECLNIKTDKFDKQIMEFVEQPGVFDKRNRIYDADGLAPTLTVTNADEKIIYNYKVRRLTPRECFRLMDFPDNFNWPVSDAQAYKQAGNSIVVNVLVKIIERLKLFNE